MADRKPIATAPTDGSKVTVLWKDGAGVVSESVGQYRDGAWWVYTDSDTQNQNQLRTGRVAAILNDLPSAVYISRTAGNGKTFEVVPGPPIEGGPYGIGFAKTNTALRDAVNRALGELVSDGTYLKILQSWGVEQGALKEPAINGA